MSYTNNEILAWKNSGDQADREARRHPRPLLLKIPKAERRYLLPGGYDISEDEGLFKLDKKGYYSKSITYSPAFAIEYLLIKEGVPRLIAKVVFVRLNEWKAVWVRIPNGFTISAKVKEAYDESLAIIKENLDPRVIGNIALLLTGAWLLEQTCFMVGTTFLRAFGIERESVMPEIIKAVKDYTLDGIESSKGVVENSFEVIDRMVPTVLKGGYHFKLCDDRNKIAVHFKRIYDEFTKYVKDKAIAGEFVDFNNFKAQLRKKGYFVKYGTARFKSDTYSQCDGEPEGCYILDVMKLRKHCDVENILTQLRWAPPPPEQGSVFD